MQTLICNEIGSRLFDKDNEDMIPMMANIEKNVKEYFNNVGITLTFIGWADTFEFDPEIQHAVNQRWAADKLASSMNTLQAITQLRVQEGLSKGLETHGLPIVVSPDTLKVLMGLVPAINQTSGAIPTPAAH